MAERIDAVSPGVPGRPAIYPWGKWMDGSAWRIRRGDDFALLPDHMAQTIRQRARRDGVAVTVSVDNSTESVDFQFGAPAEMAA